MSSKIKIGLADDHPIFRRGLSSVINIENNLEIIWEAENGNEVLENLRNNQTDVVMLDLDMPIMDGLETARNLSIKYPQIEKIVLTMHKDSQIFESMKKFDIKGYVLKDSAVNEIVECINKVANGKTYITPELTELLLGFKDQEIQTDKPLRIVSNLTGTEKQILLLIAESKTSKEIADNLCVSTRTIENHRYNITRKLNLKGNHALLKFVIANKESIQNLLNK